MSLQSFAKCSGCGAGSVCDVQRVDGKLVKLCVDCRDLKAPADTPEPADPEKDLQEAMERNKKNRERVERERLQANKSVLRSYRIKN